MSKIIRRAATGTTVFIGERHQDTLLEQQAEQTLSRFFPFVSIVTTPDGARMIPINEVLKFKTYLDEQCEEARKQGYESGHAAGLTLGQDEARAVLRRFEQAIRDAANQRQAMLEEAKQNVLELVLKVSRKVTLEAVKADPEVTLSMIEKVIDQLIDRSKLRVKVHPDFLPVIEQHVDRLMGGSTSIKELQFEADPRVKEGGCFIETPTGDIDARLESQFEVIAEAVCQAEESP